jgi:hypothetical protein
MAAKAKIAVSLSAEVLKLVDRHARGRSRSQCIEQELLRAFRAREWECLSAKLDPGDADEAEAWAETAFASAHDTLARDEKRSPRKRRGAAR